MTGLTDDQRADYKLMKAFTDASAPTPPERIKSLQRFAQRVQGTPTIISELESWDLRFEPQPAKLVGRTLPPEEICTGKGKYRDSPDSTVFVPPGNRTIAKTVLIGD